MALFVNWQVPTSVLAVLLVFEVQVKPVHVAALSHWSKHELNDVLE